MTDSKIISMRSAMVRRLEDMNMRSVFASEDNAGERLAAEMVIRRFDGVVELRHWSLAPFEARLTEFRRSLRQWASGHPSYKAHIRVLVNLDTNERLLETPLQVAGSFIAWVTNYWGCSDTLEHPEPCQEFLVRCYRSSV